MSPSSPFLEAIRPAAWKIVWMAIGDAGEGDRSSFDWTRMRVQSSSQQQTRSPTLEAAEDGPRRLSATIV